MKKQLLITIAILGNLMIASIVNATPIYSGSCQDVGFNDKGQNIHNSCTSGTLSAPNCAFSNKGMGIIRVICGDSQYIYSCGAGSYNGNWYKAQPDSYKCVV